MTPIPSSVDVSSKNLLEAVPLGAYTNYWDNEAAGASAASIFANMDDETLSQLIIDYSDQMRRLKSLGQPESDSGWKDYFGRSVNQFALGNFSDDTTLLGTAAQVGLSLAGLDLPMDVRDLTYDLTNWEWTPSHIGQTLLDAVGLLPAVGSVKYIDDALRLLPFIDTLKYTDVFGYVLGSVPKLGDLAKIVRSDDEIRAALKAACEFDDVAESTGDVVKSWGSTDNLINSATTSGKGGVSPVGRAFQKHAGNPNRTGTFVGDVSGNAAKNTEQGAGYVSEILNNPKSTYKTSHSNVFGDILDVRLPDGTGARWSADGKRFIMFLEKYTH